jgi:hypothetical protein
MDTHLPEGFRDLVSKSSGGRATNRLKVVVTDKTVALVLAGIAFGASILGLVFNHDQASQREAMESRLSEQIAMAETRRVADASAQEARLQLSSKEKETEVRMLEYYLLELDAKVIKAGIKQPSDAIALKLEAKRKEKQP